ncbi:hypothetical protein D9M68_527430 [compost metagenome]
MHLNRTLRRLLPPVLLVVFTVLAACSEPKVTLMHIHGLAFSPDGQRLSIPSHQGLAAYSDGRWSKAPGPEHGRQDLAATRPPR